MPRPTLSWSFAAALLACQPAAASPGPVDLSGTAAVVSDYRFRGVSLSSRDPAVQATLDVGYRQVFAGVFASSTADRRGAKAEVDLSAGWSAETGPVTSTAGVIAYVYPGGRGTNFAEVFGSVAKTIGPLELTLAANYAPDQANLATDSLYLVAAARAGLPGTRWSFKASAGYERGALARAAGAGGAKLDWKLGAEYRIKPVSFGLNLVSSDLDRASPNRRNGRTGIVASVTAGF